MWPFRKNQNRVIRELREELDAYRSECFCVKEENLDYWDALKEIADAPDSKSGTAAKFQRIAREALGEK